MTIAQPTVDSRTAKRDHRQEVTDAIVRMLEDGVAPWQKPWNAVATPFNPTTQRPYKGGNAVHLMATEITSGYDDPRWMTYKQAAEQGWQVRHGERGSHIEFWEMKERPHQKPTEVESGDSREGERTGRRLIHRVYTVFNAKQIDGVPAYEPKEKTPFEAVQSGERILTNSGARITHDQRDRAFYNRLTDSIHLPPKEAFNDAPAYYGTALHELAHWTGHPSRMNRATLMESYRFGDLNYAKEELRAEIASVFLAAETGVPHNTASHAAYVGSWIAALKEDKNEIFRAAHDASAATDFVLSLEREASRAEALEAGAPTAEESSLAAEQTFRDEKETLEERREAVLEVQGTTSAAGTNDSAVAAQRENSRIVARDEPGSGTVSIHDKRSMTDHHTVTEHSPAVTADGSPGEDLRASFAAAKAVTTEAMGENARTYTAQLQSGTYVGKVIGESEFHLVQRLSGRSAVAHMKELLDPLPRPGDNVAIIYSKGQATVRPLRERVKTAELAR